MNGSGEPKGTSMWSRWSFTDEPRLMAIAAEVMESALARGLAEEEASEEAVDAVVATLPKIIEEGRQSIVRQLHHGAPTMLTSHRRMRRQVQSRLDAVWGDALDLLYMVLVCCQELGADFNEAHRAAASDQQDRRFDAIVSVHARACLLASEIHALLRTGHALGAQARWRTLHELAVVTDILANGDDELANRFLLHSAVEAYEDALLHEQHRAQTGGDRFDPDELERLREIYEAARQQYGPKFSKPWRWADPVTAPHPAAFWRLEKIAQLDHLRPDVRTASHLVHGGSSGTHFSRITLGSRSLLLAGPSNGGLAEPGHGAAISLVQVTTTTVLSRYWSDVSPLLVSSLQALLALVDDCGKAFAGAADELDRIEEAYENTEERGLLGTLTNRWKLDLYRVRRRLMTLSRWVHARFGGKLTYH